MAYIAALIIHRYAMLGVLDERKASPSAKWASSKPRDDNEPKLMQGALCNEVRQPLGDPQGRLRLLHRLRSRGNLRLM